MDIWKLMLCPQGVDPGFGSLLSTNVPCIETQHLPTTLPSPALYKSETKRFISLPLKDPIMNEPVAYAVWLGLTKVIKLVFEDAGSYSRLKTPKFPWLYLARAAARGWTALVLLLLVYGADVNAIAPERGNNYFNKVHGTALEAAARFGHIEIAKILLAAGVDVDKQGSRQSNENESTESSYTSDAALSIGDSTRMKEMVRLLIDAGARVNYVLAPNATYPSDNALYRVCVDEEAFEMILAQGVNRP
jgi:hypothetical protein